MTNVNYRIEKMEITQREHEQVYGIALGHNTETQMWVTWGFKANMKNKDEIDYFWGHYYERETDALIDYHRRIIDELK